MSLSARQLVPHERAFLTAILPRVSRTFALSIAALPEALRDAVGTAYLLCRVLDTFEDDPDLRDPARAALFDAFDRALRRDGDGLDVLLRPPAEVHGTQAERQLLARVDVVLRALHDLPPQARDAVVPWVVEMGRGMRGYCARRDVHGHLVLDDLADLERYCWFVAGTVGQLLTGLFAWHLEAPVDGAMRQDASRFGLGLQLVNILKDVAEDAARGVCWLPRAVLAEHGLSADELLDPVHHAAALAVLDDVGAVARGHLRAAGRYTAAWPADDHAGQEIRRFCLVPLALAWHSLDAIAHDRDVLTPGHVPKVGREVVFDVMARAELACRDDRALRVWLDELEAL